MWHGAHDPDETYFVRMLNKEGDFKFLDGLPIWNDPLTILKYQKLLKDNTSDLSDPERAELTFLLHAASSVK